MTQRKLNDRCLVWIDTDDIEPQAREQLERLSGMPFIHNHIAVMPDVHLGKGACVGSVIPTIGAIIPAAVGVDIGCGMIAQRTSLTRDQFRGKERAIRERIEAVVPCLGRMPVYNQSLIPSAAEKVADLEAVASVDHFAGTWRLQLGSLGGGNHFIEMTEDEEGRVWTFIHSGSRGIGNKIATYYTQRAQDFCKRAFVRLEDPELAYLIEGTEDFEQYIRYMTWAQEFARLNRKEMQDRVTAVISEAFPDVQVGEEVSCHHNFTRRERHFGENVWLTRKGAVAAEAGQLGLVPGSMGTNSYVVEGLGNRLAFNSSPHGAGRRFSRSDARRRFTADDLRAQTDGVECRVDEQLVDELPAAYKDIDVVMANAEPLVKVRHTLKQFINVKGD